MTEGRSLGPILFKIHGLKSGPDRAPWKPILPSLGGSGGKYRAGSAGHFLCSDSMYFTRFSTRTWPMSTSPST